MISKEQFSASMTRECDICVHLYEKLGPDAFDFRPSPEQRSTIELLRYLSVCASAGIRCLSQNNWKLFRGYSDLAKEMTAAEFPAAMIRQRDEIAAFFEATSEETLRTQEATLPGGVVLPLGVAILNAPFKWLAAYKLQLFLYAKATGATAIGTSNAWRGADRVA